MLNNEHEIIHWRFAIQIFLSIDVRSGIQLESDSDKIITAWKYLYRMFLPGFNHISDFDNFTEGSFS